MFLGTFGFQRKVLDCVFGGPASIELWLEIRINTESFQFDFVSYPKSYPRPVWLAINALLKLIATDAAVEPGFAYRFG
jgi:hypothetical protein